MLTNFLINDICDIVFSYLPLAEHYLIDLNSSIRTNFDKLFRLHNDTFYDICDYILGSSTRNLVRYENIFVELMKYSLINTYVGKCDNYCKNNFYLCGMMYPTQHICKARYLCKNFNYYVRFSSPLVYDVFNKFLHTTKYHLQRTSIIGYADCVALNEDSGTAGDEPSGTHGEISNVINI